MHDSFANYSIAKTALHEAAISQGDILDNLEHLHQPLSRLVQLSAKCIQDGGKILVFGNGGSAAQAQHLVAELVVKLDKPRMALPAMALGSDYATMSAAGNDIGFDAVFSRPVAAFGKRGDIALAFSTSGKSPNVLRALNTATQRDMIAAAFTGGDGGELKGKADPLIVVPSDNTARIQEAHLLLTHVYCAVLERELRLA